MTNESINKWLNFLRCSIKELQEQIENITFNGVKNITSIEVNQDGYLEIKFINSLDVEQTVVSTTPIDIPDSTSDLINDSGFITLADVPAETQTTIQDPILNGNILTIYYTGENGVQQSKSVNLQSLITNDVSIDNATYDANQNIITITQTDGSSFQIDLSEFSIIPSTDVNGNVSVVQEGVEKFKIAKVGITGDYNDLLNKPIFTENDTLESVVNRGNYSSKNITFTGSTVTPTRDGAIGMNNTTYSMYFGNMNLIHTGIYNASFGYGSLENLTTGTGNHSFGHYAGRGITTGQYNTFLGYSVGHNFSNASKVITGNVNVAVGNSSLQDVTSGYKNVASGQSALARLTTGAYNVAIGQSAMQYLTTHNKSIGIGSQTGTFVQGENNVFIGTGAGRSNTVSTIETVNNRLVIHSNVNFTPNPSIGTENTTDYTASHTNGLILGDFSQRWVKFNGTFLINPLYIVNANSDNTYNKIYVGKTIDGTFGWVDRTIFQDTLVSGSNIKTVNGTSLLGSGNILVEPPISIGMTNQYLRGDKVFSELPINNMDKYNWSIDYTANDLNIPTSATETFINLIQPSQSGVIITQTEDSGVGTNRVVSIDSNGNFSINYLGVDEQILIRCTLTFSFSGGGATRQVQFAIARGDNSGFFSRTSMIRVDNSYLSESITLNTQTTGSSDLFYTVRFKPVINNQSGSTFNITNVSINMTRHYTKNIIINP